MDKIKMIGFVLVFGIFWATALLALVAIAIIAFLVPRPEAWADSLRIMRTARSYTVCCACGELEGCSARKPVCSVFHRSSRASC